MSTRVKVTMKPVSAIVTRLGLGKDGDVQRFHTNNVNRRIGKYMPHRSGALETKLKHIASDTEIEVIGPYAKYQYYGKAMEGPPPKKVTDRDLNYTKTFNPLAGPFWDRHLSASEGKAMAADLQRHVDRKAGKR